MGKQNLLSVVVADDEPDAGSSADIEAGYDS